MLSISEVVSYSSTFPNIWVIYSIATYFSLYLVDGDKDVFTGVTIAPLNTAYPSGFCF
jgi:hypothetical protein